MVIDKMKQNKVHTVKELEAIIGERSGLSLYYDIINWYYKKTGDPVKHVHISRLNDPRLSNFNVALKSDETKDTITSNIDLFETLKGNVGIKEVLFKGFKQDKLIIYSNLLLTELCEEGIDTIEENGEVKSHKYIRLNRPLTPHGLKDMLKKYGVTNDATLSRIKKAEQEYYYIPVSKGEAKKRHFTKMMQARDLKTNVMGSIYFVVHWEDFVVPYTVEYCKLEKYFDWADIHRGLLTKKEYV